MRLSRVNQLSARDKPTTKQIQQHTKELKYHVIDFLRETYHCKNHRTSNKTTCSSYGLLDPSNQDLSIHWNESYSCPSVARRIDFSCPAPLSSEDAVLTIAAALLYPEKVEDATRQCSTAMKRNEDIISIGKHEERPQNMTLSFPKSEAPLALFQASP